MYIIPFKKEGLASVFFKVPLHGPAHELAVQGKGSVKFLADPLQIAPVPPAEQFKIPGRPPETHAIYLHALADQRIQTCVFFRLALPDFIGFLMCLSAINVATRMSLGAAILFTTEA